MRYAILNNDLVINVILWDGEAPYQVDGDLQLIPDEVGPGWSLVNNEWVPPYRPDPDPH